MLAAGDNTCDVQPAVEVFDQTLVPLDEQLRRGLATGTSVGDHMLETFYTTVAQASFTLLGLWWILLQLHGRWMGEARLRRTVYDVSLYFLLPGMMSLGSLLAGETSEVWRATFAIAGLVGAAESALVIPATRSAEPRPHLLRASDWVSIGVYLAIAAVAIRRTLPETLGIHLTPLQVEGILITVLLALGVTAAATMFVTETGIDER
jgi:hypothetical protein